MNFLLCNVHEMTTDDKYIIPMRLKFVCQVQTTNLFNSIGNKLLKKCHLASTFSVLCLEDDHVTDKVLPVWPPHQRR